MRYRLIELPFLKSIRKSRRLCFPYASSLIFSYASDPTWPSFFVHLRWSFCFNSVILARRRLAAATHASFSVEKAATGLLRLASRLFSRPGLALPLTRALTYVTPPHTRPVLFESLVGHVSAAMRRLVMSVGGGKGGGEMEGEEWGAVLSVLEACAGTGGRSEADTFESVCLLVHNQNLKVTRCAVLW